MIVPAVISNLPIMLVIYKFAQIIYCYVADHFRKTVLLECIMNGIYQTMIVLLEYTERLCKFSINASILLFS